jgi:hypothetical protein
VSARFPVLLVEPTTKLIDRNIGIAVSKLLDETPDAISIELLATVVRLAILKCIFRKFPERSCSGA